MKKTAMRVGAMLLLVLIIGCALVSCGSSLRGTYENNTFGLVTVYTFSGDNYTMKMSGLAQLESGVSEEGTFSVEGDKITFYPKSGVQKTMTYSLDGKTLTIGSLEFTKQ